MFTAESTGDVADLLAGTAARLARRRTFTSATRSPLIAVRNDDAWIRLWTTAIDTFAITVTVRAVNAGLSADVPITETTTQTISVRFTHARLTTDAALGVADLGTRARPVFTTAVYTDLIIGTDPPGVAVLVGEAYSALSAPTVISTDTRTGAV